MANATYIRGLSTIANYQWDSSATDLGVVLVTNVYSQNRTTHHTYNDVLGNEAAGAGYARVPIAGAARTINENDGGLAANLRVADSTVVWVAINAGVDLRIVIKFVDGASINDPANNLLCYIDTGTNIPINTNGGNVTLNFSSDGLIKLS